MVKNGFCLYQSIFYQSFKKNWTRLCRFGIFKISESQEYPHVLGVSSLRISRNEDRPIHLLRLYLFFVSTWRFWKWIVISLYPFIVPTEWHVCCLKWYSWFLNGIGGLIARSMVNLWNYLRLLHYLSYLFEIGNCIWSLSPTITTTTPKHLWNREKILFKCYFRLI